MFSKFLFAFHIFISDGSSISLVDYQFAFDTLQQCRSAELLIQKVNSPQNCIETVTDQVTNDSHDNLRLLMKSYNSSKGENS